MATTSEELHRMIDLLSPQAQERVLAYARELAQIKHSPLPPGTPGSAIASLRVSSAGGEAMEQALEDCERVNEDEW